MSLIAKYIFFCFIAMAVNLLVQRLFLDWGLITLNYFYALLIGTAAGLVTKYLLDKSFIFKDFDNSFENNSKKFSRYSLNGVLTTIIFWGTESIAYYLYNTTLAREIGAVAGLSVGYFLKYKLDKKIVFVNIAGGARL